MVLPPSFWEQHRTLTAACASVDLRTGARKFSTQLAAHEVVVEREEDSRGAGRNGDFVVDMLHMVLGGATGDAEAPPDFWVRATFHNKLQHFDLTIAQPAGTKVLTSSRSKVACVENGGDDVRVKSAGARLTEQFVSRLRRSQRCAMGPTPSHRVEGIRAPKTRAAISMSLPRQPRW